MAGNRLARQDAYRISGRSRRQKYETAMKGFDEQSRDDENEKVEGVSVIARAKRVMHMSVVVK